MNITTIKESSAISLVDRRPEKWPHAIFATISPNPKTLHHVLRPFNGRKINAKIPYGKLPQRIQYEYCLRVVKQYIYSTKTKIFGTWELNKEGNVHFHLILSDPCLTNITDLQMFRRDILNSEIVMKNLSKKLIDYMNNIVFVNDTIEERFKYITKDIDMNLCILPYYQLNCPMIESEKGG